MSQLTEEKVQHLFSKYKYKARSCFKRGRYNDCLRYIQAAAYTGYSFYLGFKDDEIEDLLESLASYIKTDKKTDEKATERSTEECIFYDSFSVDNGGLVQQYLTAIMSCNYRIRYISERDVVLKEDSAIGNMLRAYGKAEIIIIPQKLKPFEKALFIYERIVETKASRLFIHSYPYYASANYAFYTLPKSIIKYKIDLTDHTFWIGTRFIDYSYEFRPFGCVASVTERGLNKEQVFYLPFYPIMNRVGFKGFPKEADGKLILFSGANYYKVFDVNDTFFVMVKSILDACPNMVFLFAGTGDVKVMNEKIEKHQLKGRFIPIGQRIDITECFEHCDIYLNTYPFGGGLMTQYAAQLGKPVVNYQTETTAKAEEFLCQVKQMNISDDSIETLVERVKRLVENDDFRRTYGEEIRSCVVTPDLFNELFAKSISEGVTPLPYSEDVSFVEHTMDIHDKLEYENNTKFFVRNFTKILGFSSIWQAPAFFWDSLLSVIKANRILSVLKTNLGIR